MALGIPSAIVNIIVIRENPVTEVQTSLTKAWNRNLVIVGMNKGYYPIFPARRVYMLLALGQAKFSPTFHLNHPHFNVRSTSMRQLGLVKSHHVNKATFVLSLSG